MQRSKKTFLQRRHTDDQETHEKVLNITNYYRNAKQNFNEYHFMPVRMAIIKKSTNAGEGLETKEPSYTVGGNINWYSHHGERYGGSLKKLKK